MFLYDIYIKYMKKLIVLFVIVATFCSCAMDEIPLETMPQEIAFRDSNRVEMFVNELYPYLNAGVSYNRIGGGGTGGSMADCMSDIAVYTPVGMQPELNKFILGTLTGASGGNTDARWAECYMVIRKANVFLNNVDYATTTSEAKRKRLIAEAKLHKALAHFELFKRYGGIPIMDNVLDMSGDINIPRGTVEECVNYMVRLCDEAADALPTRYPDNDYGRFTKGAALGVKAKILLYAASPLYNEKPVPEATEINRYALPDRDRWRLAVEAALAVMNLTNADGTPAHELFPSYQRTFFTRIGNTESIIMKQQAMTNNVEKANAPSGYQGARGNTNATLELINMYELKSGLKSEDDPDYNPQKPYEGRDDRFKQSIIYNGMTLWEREVEFFVGGADYPATSGVKGCVTGFTMFKHIDPQSRIVSPEKTTFHDWPVLRYAEILLIYAESMNEFLGMDDGDIVSDEKIYECVNATRARGGLDPVSNLTKAEMRELIHRERTIELAFEDQRCHDLKRWREAEVVLNQPVHGVQIIKDGANIIYNYEVNGEPYEVERRIFPMKFYFYPIPQNELDKNTALVKNPGW
ncbi:RagB/SusD family nutrient uptake outer membrane protein [termite gut metagenome]|uniref:RagB/SusD family nutrient uptake outer membrane protein n=1 Tax=termite gut metagenome TaxID=433724 RepID=A0A5J4SHR4_9ZZZZ